MSKLPKGFSPKGKIAGPVWHKWEKPGDSWTGRVVRIEPSRSFKDAKVLRGATDDGELNLVPCNAMLADLLEGIGAGERVHIVFAETKDTGEDDPMRVFEVYREGAES